MFFATSRTPVSGDWKGRFGNYDTGSSTLDTSFEISIFNILRLFSCCCDCFDCMNISIIRLHTVVLVIFSTYHYVPDALSETSTSRHVGPHQTTSDHACDTGTCKMRGAGRGVRGK